MVRPLRPCVVLCPCQVLSAYVVTNARNLDFGCMTGTPMNQLHLSSDAPPPFPIAPLGADGEPHRQPHVPRILVVDDEQLIADTIVQILNRNGFIAEAAYSGEQAIACAKRTCPELVLSDVLMPNIDGVEAAIQISNHCPDTRIVLFSGQAATIEILSRAKDRGYTFELLPKPIHPTQLIQHLRG